MGLDGPVKDLAIRGFPLAIAIPALQAARSFYYGTLISQEVTRGIQAAAFVRIAVLAVLLGGGVTFLSVNGLYLALIATVVGDLAECLALQKYTHAIVWEPLECTSQVKV